MVGDPKIDCKASGFEVSLTTTDDYSDDANREATLVDFRTRLTKKQKEQGGFMGIVRGL